MSYKKEPTIATRIKEDVMKSVMRKIQNTGESKIDFLSNAVAKEVKRLDDELNGQYYQIMRKEYYENEASYFTKGIKSFENYLYGMATNTKDIKRLENKLEAIDKKVKEDRALYEEMKKISDDFERDSPEEANKVLIGYAEKHLSKLKKEGIRIRKQVKN